MEAKRQDWDYIHTRVAEARGTGARNPALEWRWHHIFRLLRVDAMQNDIRFIDIGCGDGAFLRRFCVNYPLAKVAGVDGSREGSDRAKTAMPEGIFREIDLDSANLIVPAELLQFGNIAVCTEVLEHLDDPIQGLKNALKLLSPGARLVITVPAGPMSASDRYFGHRKHYSVAELDVELQQAGFCLKGIWAAGFPFHTLYRLIVLLRGARTIDDQIGNPGLMTAFMTKSLFAIFSLLFRLNLFWPKFGWQIFAVAEVPPEPAGRGGA